MSIEVGAGNCKILNATVDSINASCAVGNLSIELTGKETDYDYNVQCVAGNIKIGKQSFAGLAKEAEINNVTNKLIDLECAMGNITVSF